MEAVLPPSMPILWIVAVLSVNGLIGLSGGVLPIAFVRKHIHMLLAFAAGTLLAVGFLDLIPEAISLRLETGSTDLITAVTPVLAVAAGGFGLFYIIESFLGAHAVGQSGHKHDAVGPLILLGDALHNATDGLAIAAAFTSSKEAGLATAIAVIVHELPQEIGDYAILIAHGYSRKKALLSLFVVQLSSFVGAGVGLWITTSVEGISPYLMAGTAGGFIYVAAADLLPELQRHRTGKAWMKVLALVFGIAVILITKNFLHHSH